MRKLSLLALLLLCVFSLSACYRPLYGDKGFGGEATVEEHRLNDIYIGGVEGENGQKLRNLLIDRMYGQGRPVKASKRLDISLSATEEHLGLQKNAVTTRARLTVRAEYALYDSKAKTDTPPLVSGASRSVVGFSILDQGYATLSSRENAYDRALREIADLMVNRLLLYLGEAE
jgi:LPS-assembly lipoprotein